MRHTTNVYCECAKEHKLIFILTPMVKSKSWQQISGKFVVCERCDETPETMEKFMRNIMRHKLA